MRSLSALLLICGLAGTYTAMADEKRSEAPPVRKKKAEPGPSDAKQAAKPETKSDKDKPDTGLELDVATGANLGEGTFLVYLGDQPLGIFPGVVTARLKDGESMPFNLLSWGGSFSYLGELKYDSKSQSLSYRELGAGHCNPGLSFTNFERTTFGFKATATIHETGMASCSNSPALGVSRERFNLVLETAPKIAGAKVYMSDPTDPNVFKSFDIGTQLSVPTPVAPMPLIFRAEGYRDCARTYNLVKRDERFVLVSEGLEQSVDVNPPAGSPSHATISCTMIKK